MLDKKILSYYPMGILMRKGADNRPVKYISFRELMLMHNSPEMMKKKEDVKKHPYGSAEYKRAKTKLPCVLFNKFAYNLNTGFLEENEIKPFDVDLSSNTPKEIEKFKIEISKKAICTVKSTSGLKFFLRIKFSTADPLEYIAAYNLVCSSLENKYNIILDRAQGRIKQPFFISYQDTPVIFNTPEPFIFDFNSRPSQKPAVLKTISTKKIKEAVNVLSQKGEIIFTGWMMLRKRDAGEFALKAGYGISKFLSDDTRFVVIGGNSKGFSENTITKINEYPNAKIISEREFYNLLNIKCV